MIGRLSGVAPADDSAKRWRICISEYGRIKIPNAWKGWRYPVRYTTLEELGIDLETIEFHALPAVEDAPEGALEADSEGDEFEVRPLTIEEAKAGLAAHYRVKPEAIKVMIEF